MNLQQLRYLAAFSENRTLTGAAINLGVSQPAISRALHELEETLGCALFRRNGRRLELTAAGTAVLQATRRTLTAFDDIKRAVPREDAVQLLRIAGFQSMAAGFSVIYERFLRENPNVQVQLTHVDRYEEMIDMLRRRDVDLAYGEAIKPPRGWVLTEAAALEIVLISPIGTALPPVVEIADMDGLPMICPPPSEERRRLLDGPCETVGVRPRIVLQSDDPTTFVSAVRAGIGSSAVWKSVADNSTGVETRSFSPQRQLEVGFIHQAKPSALVRALLKLVPRPVI